MKKIFTYLINLFFILGFYSCSQEDGMPLSYELNFSIIFKNLDPIGMRIEIKNIDDLYPKPEPQIDITVGEHVKMVGDEKKTVIHITKSLQETSSYEDIYDSICFGMTYPVLNKDRIFNLKIFNKDNKLILEKKITLRTISDPYVEGYEDNISISARTDKVVIEPMDKYVDQINTSVSDRHNAAFVLEL